MLADGSIAHFVAQDLYSYLDATFMHKVKS